MAQTLYCVGRETDSKNPFSPSSEVPPNSGNGPLHQKTYVSKTFSVLRPWFPLKDHDKKKNRNVKIVYASSAGAGSSVIIAFVYILLEE